MQPVYQCKYEDKENLTAKVMAAIIRKDPVFRMFSSKDRARPWLVVVKCSKGHPNRFNGVGWPS